VHWETEKSDEKVLLQNVASIYIYQETDSDSGNSKLYCSLLRISFTILTLFKPPLFGRFFYAHKTG